MESNAENIAYDFYVPEKHSNIPPKPKYDIIKAKNEFNNELKLLGDLAIKPNKCIDMEYLKDYVVYVHDISNEGEHFDNILDALWLIFNTEFTSDVYKVYILTGCTRKDAANKLEMNKNTAASSITRSNNKVCELFHGLFNPNEQDVSRNREVIQGLMSKYDEQTMFEEY